jgi:hypothetical protein
LEVVSPRNVTVEVWSADPPNTYDAPNPGVRLVGFRVPAKPAEKLKLEVRLKPASK